MIYAIYFLIWGLIVAWTLIAASREPTAHGQSIILPVGFLVAVLWPLALAWALIVTIGVLIGRLRHGNWVWDR